MLRFKQFLLEEVLKRNQIDTLFDPSQIDPKTGLHTFDVYHSGSHDISSPGAIQTLSTAPKPKKASEVWNRVGTKQGNLDYRPFNRSDVITRLRTRETGEDGKWKWSHTTPSQPQSTTVGFHTTPDPVGAWAYGENKSNLGSLRPDVKITSFKASVKPEELMQFDTIHGYEKYIESLSSDPKVDKNLRAARHFREKGIKAVTLKHGTGPTVAQSGGEFIVIDPSILKSPRDAKQDAQETTIESLRQKYQKIADESGEPVRWYGQILQPTKPNTKVTSSVGQNLKNVSAAGLAMTGSVAGAALKALPIVGTAASLAAMTQRAQAGDYTGAGLEAASEVADYIPGIGTAASLGIQGYLGYHDMTPEEQEQFRKNRGAKPTEQSRRKAEETYSRQNY